MGKKSKIFYYTVLIVNIIIFILDMSPIDFPFFRISFSVSLFLIGILLIIRAINLKIDSSLFLGIILMLVGILNGISYVGSAYFSLDINQLWPYYLFAVSISSFVTSIYFKDKLQAKLCLLFLGFGAITLLFVQKLIVLWLFIVLMVVWFVAYFAFNIIRAKRRK